MAGTAVGDRVGSAANHFDGVGQTIGGYRLLALIGEGGMGRVYRAEHRDSSKLVALKTVNRVTRRRMLALRAESAVLRSVRHPGVVQILDEGTHEGIPWYTMELLTGETLADYNAGIWEENLGQTISGVSNTSSRAEAAPALEHVDDWMACGERVRLSPGSLREVLRLYRELCEPLSHIHSRGMVHRDLKPANVFIRETGGPVLMDFGLTGFATGGIGREVLDVGHRGFGTPHYTAPERLDGQLDARSDLYSFGCMLYETLVGRPPFTGDDRQVVLRHREATFPRPSELVDGIPEVIDELIVALLQKEPRARVGQASDVAAELARALGEETRPVVCPATLYRPRLWGREDALAVLERALESLSLGRGGLILMSGSSGIGKTFLTSRFSERAARRGYKVVTAEVTPAGVSTGGSQAESGGALHPFRSFLQLVADTCREAGDPTRSELLGEHTRYLASFEPSLASLVGPPSSEAALPASAVLELALSALKQLLCAFAKQGPLVLVLDDLQWADDLTINFLLSLEADFFRSVPLVIVGTYRVEEAAAKLSALAAAEPCVSLRLLELAETAVEQMIGDMLSGDAPHELVQVVSQVSEGNPFFVGETLRYLLSTGQLERRKGRWALIDSRDCGSSDELGLQLPGSLDELLLKRIRALSRDALGIVQAAAVLGRSFHIDLLAATINTEEASLLGPLAEARELQVLESSAPEVFRFGHDKLRETAYASIARSRLPLLHAAAARALSRMPRHSRDVTSRSAELARHHRLAGNWAEAIGYLEQAAEEAARQSAQREVAVHLELALEISKHVAAVSCERKARWYRAIGCALHDIGELERGRFYLRQALSALGEPTPFDSRAKLLGSIGRELVRQVIHRVVAPQLPIKRAGSEDRDLECARCFDRLQQASYYFGELLPMSFACLRTLNLAEVAPPSPELAIAYANAYAVAGILPAPSLAAIYHERVRATLDAAPDEVAKTYFLTLQGVYLIGVCRWSDAQAVIGQGLAAAERMKFGRRRRELLGLLSTSEFYRGNHERSVQHANALLGLALKTDAHTHAWALLCRAQALFCKGATDEALSDLRMAARLVQGLGRPERVWCLGLEAAMRASAGDWGRADEASRLALEEVRHIPTFTVYTVDAYARTAEVRLALYERASVNQRASAAKLARFAVTSVARLARVFPLARSRHELLLGMACRTAGQPAIAARHFRQAAERAKRLELQYDAARAILGLARLEKGGAAERRALEGLKALRADERGAAL